MYDVSMNFNGPKMIDLFENYPKKFSLTLINKLKMFIERQEIVGNKQISSLKDTIYMK